MLKGDDGLVEAVGHIAPDPVSFEAIAAFVVARPGSALAAADVRRWVREQMADYAVPRTVRVVDEIPRNATGKVDKVALRLAATG